MNAFLFSNLKTTSFGASEKLCEKSSEHRKGFYMVLPSKEWPLWFMLFSTGRCPPSLFQPNLEYLRKYFPGDRSISRITNNPRPLYSPDLTPTDYFLWALPETKVQQDNWQTERKRQERNQENSEWHVGKSREQFQCQYGSAWSNIWSINNLLTNKTLRYIPPLLKKKIF